MRPLKRRMLVPRGFFRSALRAWLPRRPRLAVALWGGAFSLGVALTALVVALVARPAIGPPADPAAAPQAASAELRSEPTVPAEPQAASPADDSPFAAIAEPPPEPPRRDAPITHVVEPGDVLWQIAEHYRLRTETLLWVNEIDNADVILVGQKLLIPPVDGVLYTVQPGEHLADVAARYGVEIGAIATANNLASIDQVQAGVDVFLPNARPLRPAAALPDQADTVQAPPAGDPLQQAAGIIPPIPLPVNIGEILTSGWLSADRPTLLYRSADRAARQLHELPAGVPLERLEGFLGGRIQVRDPGDGRTRQAMTGWVSAMDVAVGRAPAPRELSLAYPEATAMDIAHVFAPYRSQLDGSPFSEANCGPTTIGMALEAFGISVPQRQLRAEVLDAQRMWGNHVGTLMTALAEVVEQHGLTTLDLYARGGGIARWSLDDIRAHLQQGHPVVVQVRYRSLPGRGAVAYYGDHYILVTGALPDGSFLYNDPINLDGLGWDRVMSPERLRTAMDASDSRYAYAAFAVSN